QGRHTVELRKEGYDTYSGEVVITPGMTEDIAVTLLRSGTALLALSSQLQGAVVTISGLDQTYQLPTEEITLRPGEYTVEVKARGYSVWRNEVTLENGDRQIMPVQLQPKSRFGAAARSLILPGMGQFYSRRPAMGTLLLVGSGIVGYLTYQEFDSYTTIRDEHAELQRLYNQATTSHDVADFRQQLLDKGTEMETSRKNVITKVSILGGIWLVNVLDALALMPRLPRVAGAVQPSLEADTKTGRIRISLKVSF
ncbi:PEGA domain-containing protein, partial [Gemmatimonadota bacterium]